MKNLFLLTAIILLASGCAHYKPMPLDRSEVVANIEQIHQQRQLPTEKHLTFEQAVEWMDKYNRRLKELQAEYKTLQNVADIPTPLPNPSISAGIVHGEKLVEDMAGPDQPFAGLGFTIPLTRRLKIQDDLNQVVSSQKATELTVEHRRLYLDLRHRYGQIAFLDKKIEVLNQLKAFVKSKETELKKLLQSGVYSELEVAVVTQELNQIEQKLFTAKNVRLSALKELAVLLDCPFELLGKQQFQQLKLWQGAAENGQLKASLLENNFAMALQKANYQVKEKKLQLEVIKQYPDLQIGSKYNENPGNKKQLYGLSLGITLPIFDRNQTAIAKADGDRESVRRSFEKVAAEALIKLKFNDQQWQIEKQKLTHLQDVLLAQSETNRQLASKAFTAGRVSLFRYWDFEKELIELRLTEVEQQISLWQRQIELENEIGLPLKN